MNMKNKIDVKSVIIGAMGVLLVIMFIGATNQNSISDELKTKQVTIVDDDGNPIIMLGRNDDGNFIAFYDENTSPTSVWNHNVDGEGIFFYGDDTIPAVGMSYSPDVGGLVSARDLIAIVDKNYNLSSAMGNNDGEAGIMTTGFISVVEEFGGVGLTTMTRANGIGYFETRNTSGVRTSYIGTSTSENGMIELYDSQGASYYQQNK